jgi:ribosome maturation factor RimP
LEDLELRGGEMGVEDEIAEALRPVVSAAGLEIWDVERSGASVRVLVERPGGVDLDTISAVTGAISAALDRRDDLVPAGRYVLEVSSPGIERRLRYPRHFAAYLGHEVSVKLSEPWHGSRRLRGTLVGASDEEVVLRVPLSPASSGAQREHLPLGGCEVGAAAQSEDMRVPLSLVERAKAVFAWGEATAKHRTKAAAK